MIFWELFNLAAVGLLCIVSMELLHALYSLSLRKEGEENAQNLRAYLKTGQGWVGRGGVAMHFAKEKDSTVRTFFMRLSQSDIIHRSQLVSMHSRSARLRTTDLP